MGINEKHIRSADFCADQIDVIKKFAVVTNVVIKRVHCNTFQPLICVWFILPQSVVHSVISCSVSGFQSRSMYSRTSIARTPLELWEYVRDRGSSSL